MAHEEAEVGLEPVPAPEPPGRAGPPGADGTGVLGAVERLGADAAALSHPWAAQPQRVAPAGDRAAGADDELRQSLVGLATHVEQSLERVATLSSTLEQLRLSVLAGLDRTIDRFDRPAWLPQLQAAITEDRRLDELVETVGSLGDGVRATAAIADVLEGVGERLAAFEAAAERVTETVRGLEARVAPLPERLTAVAAQVDRLTPLARAADEAGSLLGQLDRFSEGLAGVSRGQDEVTAAIASVLDQVRGPMGVDAVLDLMEQRERSLVARLDRIDSELRRRAEQPPGSSAEARPRPDESVALRAALDRLDQQERAVAVQLERVGQRLVEVAGRETAGGARREAGPTPAAAAAASEPPGPVIEVLAHLARRQDDLATAIDRRLSAIETRLGAAAAAEPRPAPAPSASAQAAARRLAELRAERARVQAHLRDERLLAARSWPDEDLGQLA